jgi:nicotinate-nucleotide pyrophosphorylase (carboxylating)
LLTCERLVLNLLGRLSGIASLTRQYVKAIAGTKARIYDTRKTTPGWRRLEKYAVRCGGGFNHRLGLFDAVLIKDNHLVVGAEARGEQFTPAEAVRRARQFLASAFPERPDPMIVEVEVDTLDQLREVLSAQPDLVLLDNMSLGDLRAAVALRDSEAPSVQLEASGGVRLETVAEIARTGVDRISAGALTHSAAWLDIGLDWL